LALLFLARPADATEYRWGNVALTTKSETEWRVLKDHDALHGTKLHYVDRVDRHLFFLEVWKRPPEWWRWDAGGVERLEQYLSCSGGSNIKGEVLAGAQLPTYYCEYDHDSYGYKGRVMGKAILTANQIYFVGCEKRGGDPTKDMELVAILGSFRFLVPPQPPARYWGFELMVLMCLAAVSGVVLVVLKLRSMRKRRDEEMRELLRSEPVAGGATPSAAAAERVASRRPKLGAGERLRAHRRRTGIDPGEVQVYALVAIVLLIILAMTGLLNIYGVGVVGVGVGLYATCRIAVSKAKRLRGGDDEHKPRKRR
jgi:hypothetical protein